MREISELVSILSKLDRTINSDKRLMVRGMGILLLGKEFKDQLDKDRDIRDPTDLILNDPSIRIPEL